MFPRMKKRLKDKDKVKSIFRRSMCKELCGPVSLLASYSGFPITPNSVLTMLHCYSVYHNVLRGL